MFDSGLSCPSLSIASPEMHKIEYKMNLVIFHCTESRAIPKVQLRSRADKHTQSIKPALFACFVPSLLCWYTLNAEVSSKLPTDGACSSVLSCSSWKHG